jgi:hypothetical protein
VAGGRDSASAAFRTGFCFWTASGAGAGAFAAAALAGALGAVFAGFFLFLSALPLAEAEVVFFFSTMT